MKLHYSSFFCLLGGVALGIASSGLAEVILGSAIFPDVQRGMYYDEAIGELNQAGVVQGYDNGRFGPDDYVTRGQVAVLMKRLRDQLMNDLKPSGSLSRAQSSTSSLAASVTQEEDETQEETQEEETVQEEPVTNAQGAVRFTIDAYSVGEDAGVARISVIRAGGSQGAVTVDYAVSDGTAGSEDYEVVSGTLRFSDKETSTVFVVRIVDDNLQEGSETIHVTLSNPTGGAQVAEPFEAVLTINDDDGGGVPVNTDTFSFSALEYDVSEDGGTVAITVERSGPGNGAASVNYAANDLTATRMHYVPVSGTLSFADGQKNKAFSIDIYDNETIGGNKTVDLSLSSPSAGTALGSTTRATLTVVDDEVANFGTGSLKFTRATYTGLENDEVAVIEVSRVQGAKGTVTVDYKTSGGTAVAGVDYTAVSGTLTFLAGESKKSFTVPLVDDDQNDSGEKVNLELLNPTGGAKLTSPFTATLEVQ